MIKKGTCNRCGKCCEGCASYNPTTGCTIYETRPKGCRLYPHNPMALEPHCSIYFVDDFLGVITGDNYTFFSEGIKLGWLDLEIEDGD